jgi:recombinational DNA repair ATPase RecF
MKLDIFLHNWKCFKSQQFSIPQKSFAIVDSNGKGKTTILSALYSLYTGKPWPGTKFGESIKNGSQYYGIVSQHTNWNITGQLQESGRIKNQFSKPKSPENILQLEKWPKIFTYLPTDNYWFSNPNKQVILILDNIIGQIYDDYIPKIKHLEKSIQSKNNYIKYCQKKQIYGDRVQIEQLTKLVLKNSIDIWEIRNNFLIYLQKELPEFNSWIQNNQQKFTINYKITSSFGIKESFSKVFTLIDNIDYSKLWQKELIVGRCLFGAHRDELGIYLGQKNINTILSRGETRLLVLFIKNIARKLVLQNDKTQKVWWFLDDIFNELDSQRELLFYKKTLKPIDYSIVSSTKKADFIPNNFSVSDLTI